MLLAERCAIFLGFEAKCACPLIPVIEELIAREDLAKGYEVEIRQLGQINEPCAIFGTAYKKRDRGEVFGAHDTEAVVIPFHDHGLFDSLSFESG